MRFHANITEALLHCARTMRRSSGKLKTVPETEHTRPTVPSPPPDDVDDTSPTERMPAVDLGVMRAGCEVDK